ncbi:hypothetical protein CNECB9_5010006 [Cupriavidus necator]|uniref:Uncharacterized protein n=1 Tax=Cupriavidus necator TaxID=106590 RepID=A0A1K0JLY6_CUPNE|nr:hypothetical protein CNECB9_5010006 [Cupriavidus necator]
MRDHALPAAQGQRMHQRLRVMAAGIALQAVEHHHQRRVRAHRVGGPVEVDEVLVGGVPALAAKAHARRAAREARGDDGLGMAAAQPPGHRHAAVAIPMAGCGGGVSLDGVGQAVVRKLRHAGVVLQQAAGRLCEFRTHFTMKKGREGCCRAAGLGVADAAWSLHARRLQRRHAARQQPSLRVQARRGACVVAGLDLGMTKAGGPRLACAAPGLNASPSSL